jgi:hypothetical protein
VFALAAARRGSARARAASDAPPKRAWLRAARARARLRVGRAGPTIVDGAALAALAALAVRAPRAARQGLRALRARAYASAGPVPRLLTAPRSPRSPRSPHVRGCARAYASPSRRAIERHRAAR